MAGPRAGPWSRSRAATARPAARATDHRETAARASGATRWPAVRRSPRASRGSSRADSDSLLDALQHDQVIGALDDPFVREPERDADLARDLTLCATRGVEPHHASDLHG